MQHFDVNTTNGWTEVILLKDCEMQKVSQVAAILTDKLNIQFTQRMNNTDTLYWDFKYEGAELCLHYNLYLGISIHPVCLKEAEEWENEAVIKVSKEILSNLLSL